MRSFKIRTILLTLLLLSLSTLSSAEYLSDLILTSPDATWVDSRAYSSISDAVSTIGSSERTLLISQNENCTALTIPSNIHLYFTPLGSITNTGNLSIKSTHISASDHQIFTGTGEIDFARGTNVYSSWFSDLSSMFNLTNDNYVTCIINSGWSANVDSDCQVGDNVTLKWLGPGHRVIINPGFTLSNISKVEAGNYRIFSGSGDFDFLDGTDLNLSWFNRLRSANSYIESEEVTLTIQGSHTITYDETLTSNIALDFSKSGSLNITAGNTLTIHSPSNITATSKWIFTNTGTVEFTAEGIIPLEWYGMSPDATAANNSLYGNKALDNLPPGSTVTYNLNGETELTDYLELYNVSNVTFKFGSGVIFKGTAANYLLFVHGVNRTDRLDNIRLSGGTFDGDSTSTNGIVFQYMDNSIIEDTETNDFTSNGISWLGETGVTAPTEYNNKIINCRGSDNGAFGITVGKQQTIEIASCDFRNSGDSDYNIKNCADFNIHDSKSYGSTEQGINIRHSKQGQDVYGKVINNEVSTTGKVGIYIHGDDNDSVAYGDVTSVIRDILVEENRVHNTTWSCLTIFTSVNGDYLDRAIISNNIFNLTQVDGVVAEQVRYAVIEGNVFYLNNLGRHGVIGTPQDSVIQGNVFYQPGKAGTDGYATYFRDNPTNPTYYALRNLITGNRVYAGTNTPFAFFEASAYNSDYNRYESNYVYNLSSEYWVVTHGANDVAIIPDYYSLTTEVSTSGAGEDTLATFDIQNCGPSAQFEVEAYGTVTDAAGGNKTIILYGDAAVFLTIRAAANDNTDWFVRLRIDKYSDTGNHYFYTISDLDGDWEYVHKNDDIGDGSTTFTLTGECSNAADTITMKAIKVKRVR